VECPSSIGRPLIKCLVNLPFTIFLSTSTRITNYCGPYMWCVGWSGQHASALPTTIEHCCPQQGAGVDLLVLLVVVDGKRGAVNVYGIVICCLVLHQESFHLTVWHVIESLFWDNSNLTLMSSWQLRSTFIKLFPQSQMVYISD